MIVKLTQRAVGAFAPGAKPYIAYDADLVGFGLRILPTGVKSWVVEYRPNGGGRGVAKRRVTIGKATELTAEQARRAATETLARVRFGDDPMQDRADRRKAVTLAELIILFEAQYVGPMVKPTTAVSHKIALAELRQAHGSLKAEALSKAHVATLHARMADRPYAANRAVAVWGKLFSWAAEQGLVPADANPTKGLKKYREQGRERFLTSDELARLGVALAEGEAVGLPYAVDETKAKAKHAPKPASRLVRLDPFAAAAIRLLILTGARLREILDAQWTQVDFQRGMMFLPDSKTGKKPIYLGAAALAVLEGLPRIEGNPHIIAGAKDGAPRADLQRPWAAVRRAAGLEGVRLHDLRHSFASVAAGASLGLPIIGKLLGHTQASTTARYAHLDADPLRRAADTIGATIAAALGGKGGGEVVEIVKGRRARGE